jgi:hypothetical protein
MNFSSFLLTLFDWGRLRVWGAGDLVVPRESLRLEALGLNTRVFLRDDHF